MIHSSSIITFHKLRVSIAPDENGEYAIVRWDTDDSIKTSLEVANLIKELAAGKSLHEAAHQTGFSIADACDIIESLKEAGLVKQIDSQTIADSSKHIHPWLLHINRKWFRWIISKPLILAAYSFIISGIIIGVFTPGYFPSYRDYFWTDDYFLVFVSVILLDMFFLFIHELGHFAVTKAVGGEARIRFSRRFIYVVAETESYHLAVVPKTLRYFVYFGGMFVDFFIIACTYWLFYFLDWKGIEIGLIRNFLTILVLIKIQGIVWQYNAFLETDMYNFLTDLLNHDNLITDTRNYLGKRFIHWSHVLPLPVRKQIKGVILKLNRTSDADATQSMNKTQRTQVLIFSFILTTGLIFTFLQFAIYSIPKDLTFIAHAITSITHGWGVGDVVMVIKSAVLLVLILYPYLILLYVSLRREK